MNEEMKIARQWLAKARNDLLCADNNLASRQVPCDMVCFHCQQAAEKMLKAFLVALSLPYPLTHDLFLLKEKIRPIRPDIEMLKEALAILNPYAVEIRYPDDSFIPTLAEAQEARDAARQVFAWLLDALPALQA